MAGRDFTDAEEAALAGHNHLASYLMRGGKPKPQLYAFPIIIGPIGGAAALEEAAEWWAPAAGETRVTRWMSETEYNAMKESGNLQVGAGGRTYVTAVGAPKPGGV